MDAFQRAALNRWLSALAADVIRSHIGTPSGAASPVPEDRAARSGRAGGGEPDVWRAVAGHDLHLPRIQQEVLELRLRDGASYREIAERLALPLGTVHSRIARAKATLRKLADTHRSDADTRPPAPAYSTPVIAPAAAGEPVDRCRH